jgi:hypothetical protein
MALVVPVDSNIVDEGFRVVLIYLGGQGGTGSQAELIYPPALPELENKRIVRLVLYTEGYGGRIRDGMRHT